MPFANVQKLYFIKIPSEQHSWSRSFPKRTIDIVVGFLRKNVKSKKIKSGYFYQKWGEVISPFALFIYIYISMEATVQKQFLWWFGFLFENWGNIEKLSTGN